MHIAILVTNTDVSAFARRHPGDGEKFAQLLKPYRKHWKFTAFSVKDDVFPESLAEFDGAIITGSPASVHDDAPWIPRLLDLIRQAADSGFPLFGACFGHQAIAMALGGAVGKNPGGWVFGRVDTAITSPAPWLEGAPAPLSLYAAHSEQVTHLPDGARVLGGTPDCPIGSFALGDRIWTTQYHPEMTPAFISELVEEYDGKLPDGVIAAARASLHRQAEQEKISRWIIAFFEHAASRHQSRTANKSIAVT